MAEQIRCPSNHEQSETQTLGFFRIEAMKSVEHFRHLSRRYANARIVNFDTNIQPGASTPHENSTPFKCVFDRIPEQIAQDATEEGCVTHDDCAGRTDANRQAALLRPVGTFLTQAIEERRKLDGREQNSALSSVQPHRIDEMVELLAQPVGRQFAEFEVLALPSRGIMPLKPSERAKNKLQRLSQVMSRHCKQHFAEFPSAAQVRLTPTADALSLI